MTLHQVFTQHSLKVRDGPLEITAGRGGGGGGGGDFSPKIIPARETCLKKILQVVVP